MHGHFDFFVCHFYLPQFGARKTDPPKLQFSHLHSRQAVSREFYEFFYFSDLSVISKETTEQRSSPVRPADSRSSRSREPFEIAAQVSKEGKRKNERWERARYVNDFPRAQREAVVSRSHEDGTARYKWQERDNRENKGET